MMDMLPETFTIDGSSRYCEFFTMILVRRDIVTMDLLRLQLQKDASLGWLLADDKQSQWSLGLPLATDVSKKTSSVSDIQVCLSPE